MERVVITGMGTVNALAKNTVAFARALQEGACGIGPLTVFDTSGYRTCNGAEVKHFNPREMIPPSFSLKRMSRADNLAFAATIEALKESYRWFFNSKGYTGISHSSEYLRNIAT
jgi:3-oxoacyl-[acyl-carrier-protein] synthase II